MDSARLKYIRSHVGDPIGIGELADLVATEFGITSEEALADIDAALEQDRQLEASGDDFKRDRMIAMYRSLYAEAKAAGQYSAAVATAARLEKALGLDEPQQVNVSIGAPNPALVRDRIQQLLRAEHVNQKIIALGVSDDVTQLALDAGVEPGPDEFIEDATPEPRSMPLWAKKPL